MANSNSTCSISDDDPGAVSGTSFSHTQRKDGCRVVLGHDDERGPLISLPPARPAARQAGIDEPATGYKPSALRYSCGESSPIIIAVQPVIAVAVFVIQTTAPTFARDQAGIIEQIGSMISGWLPCRNRPGFHRPEPGPTREEIVKFLHKVIATLEQADQTSRVVGRSQPLQRAALTWSQNWHLSM